MLPAPCRPDQLRVKCPWCRAIRVIAASKKTAVCTRCNARFVVDVARDLDDEPAGVDAFDPVTDILAPVARIGRVVLIVVLVLGIVVLPFVLGGPRPMVIGTGAALGWLIYLLRYDRCS